MDRRAPAFGSSDAQGVLRWVVLAAVAAPVLLVVGWTLAADRQRTTYDPRTDTISALAADGADARWIMTGTFVAVGLCYVLTALALRAPALPGRIALAAGGIATIFVAIFPQPSGGSSHRHGVVAAIASSAVALWPALAARRDPRVSWPLRPMVAVTVSIVLIALLVWFASELQRDMLAGLSERVAAGAQALWVGVATATLGRSAFSLERAEGSPH